MMMMMMMMMMMKIGILFTLRPKNDSEQKRIRGDNITRQIRHGSGAHENTTKRVKKPTNTNVRQLE